MGVRLTIAGLTALAVVMASCSDVRRAAPSTSPLASVVPEPSAAPVSAAATTTVSRTSSTTVPAASSTEAPTVIAVVPWVAAPARLNQRLEFALTLPATHRTAPACSVRALEVLPSADGAMGTVYGSLAVHNFSETACEVQGVPFVELVDNEGRIVQSTNPVNLRNNTAPVVLEPNSWAQANLGPVASNTCGGDESSTLRVRWHDGATTLPFALGRPPDPVSCPGIQDHRHPGGLQPPHSGPYAFAALSDASTQSFGYVQSALSTTIDAPHSARAGAILRFSVQMVNSTENVMVFVKDACPIYQATLATAKIEMLLNCAGRDGEGITIPSGSAVRFEMQLQIPSDIAAGPQTLTWTWAEPAGPTGEATVNILG